VPAALARVTAVVDAIKNVAENKLKRRGGNKIFLLSYFLGRRLLPWL
jgi:hypothetical protein